MSIGRDVFWCTRAALRLRGAGCHATACSSAVGRIATHPRRAGVRAARPKGWKFRISVVRANGRFWPVSDRPLRGLNRHWRGTPEASPDAPQINRSSNYEENHDNAPSFSFSWLPMLWHWPLALIKPQKNVGTKPMSMGPVSTLWLPMFRHQPRFGSWLGRLSDHLALSGWLGTDSNQLCGFKPNPFCWLTVPGQT